MATVNKKTKTMSAFGPKQTWASAPHMSALGGKADIAEHALAT
jgi:hypothetical protein